MSVHGRKTVPLPTEQSGESVTQTTGQLEQTALGESGEVNASSDTQTPITPSGSERAIVEQLEQCIELFRCGKWSKPIAITTIVNAANSSNIPADARQDTINSYLALLDDIEKKAKSLQERARWCQTTQTVAGASPGAEGDAGDSDTRVVQK
ncbi:hypothetical protein C0993_006793 [Termitomyces sp. T159_Od127]|nr:hypothetical protein C0993_006793 [Termitomyces sp. T159_Od127]